MREPLQVADVGQVCAANRHCRVQHKPPQPLRKLQGCAQRLQTHALRRILQPRSNLVHHVQRAKHGHMGSSLQHGSKLRCRPAYNVKYLQVAQRTQRAQRVVHACGWPPLRVLPVGSLYVELQLGQVTQRRHSVDERTRLCWHQQCRLVYNTTCQQTSGLSCSSGSKSDSREGTRACSSTCWASRQSSLSK